MLTAGNDTAGASGTGPGSGYKLMLSRLFMMFVLFLYRLNANMNNIYAAIILLILNTMIFLMDFGIKIYHKMPKFLTVVCMHISKCLAANDEIFRQYFQTSYPLKVLTNKKKEKKKIATKFSLLFSPNNNYFSYICSEPIYIILLKIYSVLMSFKLNSSLRKLIFCTFSFSPSAYLLTNVSLPHFIFQ
jgi:hypothetical protein